MMTVAVAAFYKFVPIVDAAALRDKLIAAMTLHNMKGTILLAAEGINGTISAAPTAMAAFLVMLRTDPRFADLVTKDAVAEAHPFQRLKVKLKREIVTFGQPGADPTVRAGTYVAPSDWNALISESDVLVLDTRNAYEVAEGTFQGAVNPNTRSFAELPKFITAALDPSKHRRVAMFCTGGIRCEKASAYLLSLGFPEVYHLQGGILSYLSEVAPQDSQFDGKCFVFDERTVVGDDK